MSGALIGMAILCGVGASLAFCLIGLLLLCTLWKAFWRGFFSGDR